jgi:hypothetical protein
MKQKNLRIIFFIFILQSCSIVLIQKKDSVRITSDNQECIFFDTIFSIQELRSLAVLSYGDKLRKIRRKYDVNKMNIPNLQIFPHITDTITKQGCYGYYYYYNLITKTEINYFLFYRDKIFIRNRFNFRKKQIINSFINDFPNITDSTGIEDLKCKFMNSCRRKITISNIGSITLFQLIDIKNVNCSNDGFLHYLNYRINVLMHINDPSMMYLPFKIPLNFIDMHSYRKLANRSYIRNDKRDFAKIKPFDHTMRILPYIVDTLSYNGLYSCYFESSPVKKLGLIKLNNKIIISTAIKPINYLRFLFNRRKLKKYFDDNEISGIRRCFVRSHSKISTYFGYVPW